MSKHTPGPWSADFGETARIADPRGATLARATNIHLGGRRPANEVEANAHLIAAAPEMYDLLATIENDGEQVPAWLWDKIQAVLAKARGEAVQLSN